MYRLLSMASARAVDESKTASEQSELEDRLIKALHGTEDPEQLIRDRNCLNRYLRARDWNVKEAAKLLQSSIKWRQEMKAAEIVCHACKENQGHHAMRQVGHDDLGRPVFYSSFTQGRLRSETAEAAVQHIVYLLEQSCRTLKKGADACVWVMDCDGMLVSACNPRVAYGVNQVISFHYPERLGHFLCINSGMLMRGAWTAIKPFIAPRTAAKLHFLPNPLTTDSFLNEHIGKELASWLVEEAKLNCERPMRESQHTFWAAPPRTEPHDPRGCRSYVDEFLLPYYSTLREKGELTVHNPHPNIRTALKGCLSSISV